MTHISVICVIGSFDGACEPVNPGGYACGGWVVEAQPDAGVESRAGHRFYCSGEGATNNVAEYNAALDCLRAIYSTGYRGSVLLRGDSMLVVKQMTGEWACNKERLRELREKLRFAMTFFESVEFEWVPRERNVRADAMSRAAYREARRRGT